MPQPKAPGRAPVAVVKRVAKPRGKRPRGWPKGCLYMPDEIDEMFRRFRLQRPNPKSDLAFLNPFTLLVAVVLSAQATDASVNIATEPLFRIADTPEKMAALGEEEIGRHVRTIGLWRAKAKNVALLSEALIRDHGGEVPQTEEELIRLPGVGRKTANVVRNNAFGHPTMGVDTHIFRLGNRIHLAPGKTPDQVERGLLAVIPAEYMLGAHHWLILHGRYVCKARRPECERCIIADLCLADVKTSDVPAPIEVLD
ncbi:MAG: endonuclease III [Mesorhizobium amorphae]|nr:MAG: endonuclease III [Mesorhizobium amorphae]